MDAVTDPPSGCSRPSPQGRSTTPKSKPAAGRIRRPRPAYARTRGATLGILGYGRIGRAIADKAVGFGMNIIAYDSP